MDIDIVTFGDTGNFSTVDEEQYWAFGVGILLVSGLGQVWLGQYFARRYIHA